jgi:anti-anti-sigma factor
MIVQQDQFRIHARLAEIAAACKFVREMGIRAGLDEKALHHCQLAVDEACTNIIDHGYSGERPDEVIDILTRWQPGALTIEIVDSGAPFNPLEQPLPDPRIDLDQRQQGGWGVCFIVKLMDEVNYQRRDGRNYLWMTKRQTTAQANRQSQENENRVTGTDGSDRLQVMTLSGRIDAAASDELELVFMQHLEKGRRLLILDMAGVDYVSSRGLRMLVTMWKRAHDAQGELVLSGLQPAVSEVMRLLGLDLVFTIFAALDDARAHYRS